jgi:hypothetical protein
LTSWRRSSSNVIRETKFLSAIWIVCAEIADNILKTCERHYQHGSLMATEVLPHGMLPWEDSRPVISIFHHCIKHHTFSKLWNSQCRDRSTDSMPCLLKTASNASNKKPKGTFDSTIKRFTLIAQ